MALTREFCETVRERARGDSEFRAALLAEAAEAIVNGEAVIARALLRDYINATLGFESLAMKTDIPPKSLHRMFGANGNPTLTNLSRVLQVLESDEGIAFEITTKAVAN